MNTNREIDFKKLHKLAKPYCEHGSLDAAELMGASLQALEQWEHCGGRNLGGFHRLLDTVEQTLGCFENLHQADF